jgi:hypothetical protein
MEVRDVRGREAPLPEAFLPGRGRLRPRGLECLAVAPRRVGVDPGRERLRGEVVEEQQEVAEISLGIDGEHGHALAEDLFDEGDGEAGLARPGHSHDEAVREEVCRIEPDRVPEPGRLGVELLADVEAGSHAPGV